MKAVFVASSRKYYDEVREIKKELDARGVKGFYPYFEYHDEEVEADQEQKKKLTLSHFPELDQVEVLYAIIKDGHIGYSVTIELTYAYARGAEIICSEQVDEFAVQTMVSKVMTPTEFIEYASA